MAEDGTPPPVMFDLHIEIARNSYALGEDVYVTFRLRNTSGDTIGRPMIDLATDNVELELRCNGDALKGRFYRISYCGTNWPTVAPGEVTESTLPISYCYGKETNGLKSERILPAGEYILRAKYRYSDFSNELKFDIVKPTADSRDDYEELIKSLRALDRKSAKDFQVHSNRLLGSESVLPYVSRLATSAGNRLMDAPVDIGQAAAVFLHKAMLEFAELTPTTRELVLYRHFPVAARRVLLNELIAARPDLENSTVVKNLLETE